MAEYNTTPRILRPLDRPPTPAILVTGFLGSGKTSFILNTLLPLLRDRQPMLLVNDFGEVGFDARYLDSLGLPVREVAGGCLCCSAGGRLIEALAAIRATQDPGVLIIEGSGIADPRPVLEALETGAYALEGIVGLVEPRHLDHNARDPVFHEQLRASQIVVMSRGDDVEPEILRAARTWLENHVRSGVPVFLGREGQVDEGFLHLLSNQLPAARKADVPGSGRKLGQRCFKPAGFWRRRDLLEFLGKLPAEVFRVKGICELAESPRPVAVNYAFGQWTLHPVDDEREAFLVAMGEQAPLVDLEPPSCLPPDRAPAGDAEMLPEGGGDAREGAAFIEGKAVSEIAAAEAVITRLNRERRIIFLRDAGFPCPSLAHLRPHGLNRVMGVEDYRYRHLMALARELATGPQATVVTLGIPAAVVDLLLTQLAEHPVIALCEHWAIPRATVSMRGMDATRVQTLLHCLDTLAHPTTTGSRAIVREPSIATEEEYP
ncbi:CobW family GTP-binding protein [Thioalkalivibrio sulfidiphilus]|uniref:CobW family GTP-binding protein n=1 Tax=Thioalkalivibrio sulfidiphilus TaxID=1033854 RepID=UPI00036EEFDE|nr:GTP-binding protein [Thioalkalivibrio sulfidiphilus]